mmetsp:Transcript_22160/g.36232  ORF Transcript_22160/g.36232 Transcript_22160/m.36232 type:complete len:212 (-) Transcript_22160:389-1024(-)
MPIISNKKSNVAADNNIDEEEALPLFVLDDEELDQDTKDVLDARITPGTRKGYIGSSVAFMLWAFDSENKYGDIFTPSTLEELKAAHQKDKERRTTKGKPNKSRDNIRSKCKELLGAITKGDESTFPIKLENITFCMFSRFLGSLRKVTKGKNSNEGDKVIVRLKLSSYEAYCSALAYLFTECGKEHARIDFDVVYWGQRYQHTASPITPR